MSTPASALPRTAQVKLEALENVSRESPEAIKAAADAAAKATTDAALAEAAKTDTVTLSRGEYNDLQASAGKTRVAEGRAETERLQREELTFRLTELEKASKASPEPVVSSALAEEAVVFTPEEEKDFGDSREFITKVVKIEFNKLVKTLNTLTAKLESEVAAVKQTATGAVSTVRAVQEKSFFGQVQAAVPSLDSIRKHKNWNDFLDETDDFSGATYEQLLAHNVKQENLKPVVNIYKKFTDKYMQSETNANARYAGGIPSGAATEAPVSTGQLVKLKQSDRKKASEDYRKGKITYDQLQVVSKKFEEAEKAGNIDYDN